MANVQIYTTTYCPYCSKAKMLLDKKNVQYQEINVEGDDEARAKLVAKAGGRKTVPQIFINDKHIGGCDELYALETNGELEHLLK